MTGAVVVAALGVSGAGAVFAADCPQPFVVRHALEWRGISAGTSTLELTRKSANQYLYKSSNSARGLFRLAFPDTITQTSELSVVNGEVLPLSYVADDGSSDKSRDVTLKFDWNVRQVTGTAEGKPVTQLLPPGTQDPMSVQIALMCALAAGQSPTHFGLIDKDEVTDYQYVREGSTTLDTKLGKLDTVIYTSQRPGSSRLTRWWLAPSLGFLPVQAEQLRRGKREFSLEIRELKRE